MKAAVTTVNMTKTSFKALQLLIHQDPKTPDLDQILQSFTTPTPQTPHIPQYLKTFIQSPKRFSSKGLSALTDLQWLQTLPPVTMVTEQRYKKTRLTLHLTKSSVEMSHVVEEGSGVDGMMRSLQHLLGKMVGREDAMNTRPVEVSSGDFGSEVMVRIGIDGMGVGKDEVVGLVIQHALVCGVTGVHVLDGREIE
ncbi:hypothetical protein HDU67_000265, partial [Dinochytrium kinnereticum]